MIYFIIFGIFLIVGTVVSPRLARQEKKKIEQVFAALAETYHLEKEIKKLGYWEAFTNTAYPELKGLYQNKYALHIYIQLFNSNSSSNKYLVFDLNCRHLNTFPLKLSKATLARKIGKKIGLQKDILLRDQEFDNQFIVESTEHLFVKELLADPDLREVILEAQESFDFGALELKDQTFHFKTTFKLDSPQTVIHFKNMLNLTFLLIQRLEEMSSGASDDLNP